MNFRVIALMSLLTAACGAQEQQAAVALSEPAPAVCAVPPDEPPSAGDQNVFGGPLAACSAEPLTGYRRNGSCTTGPDDRGVHVVCAEVTDAFLSFTRSRGNDLTTPVPGRFPGLRAGDRWCLCASRWAEAAEAGAAPPVVLEATHSEVLRYVTHEQLEAHAR